MPLSLVCFLLHNSEFCVFAGGGQCVVTFNNGASSYVAVFPDSVEFTKANEYRCDRVYGVSAFDSLGGTKRVHCVMSASNTTSANSTDGNFNLKADDSNNTFSPPYRIYYRVGDETRKALMGSDDKVDLGFTTVPSVSNPIIFVLYPTSDTEIWKNEGGELKLFSFTSAVTDEILASVPVGVYTEILTFTFSVEDNTSS